MKNLSNVLHGVLFIAVAILYFLYFSNKNDSDPEDKGTALSNFGDMGMAYVNSDSLLAKYEYFKEIQDKLLAKRDKLNKDYQTRAEGLQKEISNFQNTAGNMTMNQAQAVQEDLKRKQQNLMMYQDQLSQQLMKEENQMNGELYNKISDYLKVYGQENDLIFVLTYSKGSGVLYANDSLDITTSVISGLNEEYNNEMSKDKAVADTNKSTSN